jgi:hypothetical protein
MAVVVYVSKHNDAEKERRLTGTLCQGLTADVRPFAVYCSGLSVIS